MAVWGVAAMGPFVGTLLALVVALRASATLVSRVDCLLPGGQSWDWNWKPASTVPYSATCCQGYAFAGVTEDCSPWGGCSVTCSCFSTRPGNEYPGQCSKCVSQPSLTCGTSDWGRNSYAIYTVSTPAPTKAPPKPETLPPVGGTGDEEGPPPDPQPTPATTTQPDGSGGSGSGSNGNSGGNEGGGGDSSPTTNDGSGGGGGGGQTSTTAQPSTDASATNTVTLASPPNSIVIAPGPGRSSTTAGTGGNNGATAPGSGGSGGNSGNSANGSDTPGGGVTGSSTSNVIPIAVGVGCAALVVVGAVLVAASSRRGRGEAGAGAGGKAVDEETVNPFENGGRRRSVAGSALSSTGSGGGGGGSFGGGATGLAAMSASAVAVAGAGSGKRSVSPTTPVTPVSMAPLTAMIPRTPQPAASTSPALVMAPRVVTPVSSAQAAGYQVQNMPAIIPGSMPPAARGSAQRDVAREGTARTTRTAYYGVDADGEMEPVV
ncbi:hypothetical protein DFJ73DRAFT_961600 [Zopfochytrium polystomum]|nr:hypothetical protein DFJ73DRAFT_961600 [Zopfochytrium polystomum]